MLAQLNPIAFYLLGWPVRWYGLIIATGVLIALWMAIKEGQRHGIDEDHFYNLLLLGIPCALVGARGYYVIFEWSYYRQHLAEIPALWDGGIAIYGGLIGGLLLAVGYANYRHLRLATILDCLAPGILVGQIMGRWGNFMNQEAFGAVTTHAALVAQHLPNWLIQQMQISGAYRTPTFLYESLGNLIGLILILSFRHRAWFKAPGNVFRLYLLWYAIVRMIVEGMRTDSLMLGPIRVSQALSVVILVVVGINWMLMAWHHHVARKE